MADLASPISLHKLAQAKNAIIQFSAAACWAGVSWGKDSVVLAHLVRAFAPSVPLAFVRTTRTNPDCMRVRDAFLALFPGPYVEIEEPVAGWPHWGFGIPLLNARFGSRSINGVRAEESGQRALSAAVHGVATAKTCRPLIRWSAQDVFSHLATNGLPVHPAYAMTGGGRWDRGRIRVGSLGGVRGDGRGRAEWEREYYGDVINRLLASNNTHAAYKDE